MRVVLDPGTPLPGARAHIVLQRLATVGHVSACEPAPEAMLADGFAGAFALRLDTTASPEDVRRLALHAGAVREVVFESAGSPAEPTSQAAWTEGSLSAPLQRYVRIDLRRLDTLLNLVGELVILRGRLAALAEPHDDTALADAIAQAGRLIGEVQDSVLGSRMVPVWQVFDRFPRVVRDAARSLGKEIEFVLAGREIELDRVLLEQIADPLVHLLRNALDHGLESAFERAAAGKPRAGRLTLSAARERSAVVISVADDGRGVDRDRVLARAREMGLVDAEQTTLSEDEAFRLIARPGFSTAREVSEVSGRGVGFDAVVARVRGLGGSVEMTTCPGAGTTFTIRLPVTLAIIPALLAMVGDETYALPLTHVTETIQPRRGTVARVRGRPVFVLRGEVFPLLSLRQVVGLSQRDPEGCQIVLVQASERRAALLVDHLLGQRDIVVKPFDAARDALGCFSGATILPDGAAALILDVGVLQ
jgi:two-component system chemotaxis sensor kinase CheA